MTGGKVRDQSQPQTGDEEDELLEEGDQSQAEEDGEPVPKRRSIESNKPVSGEEVCDQPQLQTGEDEDSLLVEGTSLNQLRLVGIVTWILNGMMRKTLRWILHSTWESLEEG